MRFLNLEGWFSPFPMGDKLAPAWVLPPVLHPHHESHGRDHDAFSVAIGAGHSHRPAFALTPYPTLLKNVGAFLSNAAGALLLPSSLSRNYVLNHASLLLFVCPCAADNFADLTFPFPAQPRKINSRRSCVQRMVRRARLSCLAVSPNCFASGKST